MSKRPSTASRRRPEMGAGAPLPPRQENAAAIQLLEAWLADESGYDEAAWDSLKAAMRESRRSSRDLFRD